MMTSITGLVVMVHDRCLNCDTNACFATRKRLVCDGCGVSRGLVSPELATFLEKFVDQFGWPDRPIILRSGKLHKPEQPAVAAETQLKSKHKRKAKTKMKLDQLFPSKYLRSADLGGETKIVVVDRVETETFKNDGKEEKKAVLHFRGGGLKPFITNKTNSLVMAELSGSDDTDDWAGTRIALSPTVVSFKGKATQSVRVGYAPKDDKSIVTGAKAKAKPEAKPEVKPDFDDEIAI
jgi:hypothetical protein